MPRGGRNSGTLQPTWKAGKTTVIRVPVAKKEELQKLLRALDEIESLGESAVIIPRDTLLKTLEILKEALLLKPNAGGAIKEKIREVIDMLEL